MPVLLLACGRCKRALDHDVRWHAIDRAVDHASQRDPGNAVDDRVELRLERAVVHRVDRQQASRHVAGNLPGIAIGHRGLRQKFVEQDRVERCLEKVEFLPRQKGVVQEWQGRRAQAGDGERAGIQRERRAGGLAGDADLGGGLEIPARRHDLFGGLRTVRGNVRFEKLKHRRHGDRFADGLRITARGSDQLPGDVEFHPHPLIRRWGRRQWQRGQRGHDGHDTHDGQTDHAPSAHPRRSILESCHHCRAPEVSDRAFRSVRPAGPLSRPISPPLVIGRLLPPPMPSPRARRFPLPNCPVRGLKTDQIPTVYHFKPPIFTRLFASRRGFPAISQAPGIFHKGLNAKDLHQPAGRSVWITSTKKTQECDRRREPSRGRRV